MKNCFTSIEMLPEEIGAEGLYTLPHILYWKGFMVAEN
jgi:hypothetical protein